MGTNLTSRDVQLVHDGISYTPLQSSQSDWLFLLGSNGTNVITVNGRWLCTIVVEGVVVPDGLPTYMTLGLYEGVSGQTSRYSIVRGSSDCINFPHPIEGSFNCFSHRLGNVDSPFTTREGIVAHNASLEVRDQSANGYMIFKLIPDDASSPCWLTFQGYVVGVYNYS